MHSKTTTFNKYSIFIMITRIMTTLVMLGIVSLYTPGAIYAAEKSDHHSTILQADTAKYNHAADDPLGAITTKITDLTKKLAKIATPIASLAIVFVLVMYVFGGLMPELVQQYKGFIIRALLIVVIIGFIPDVVNAFAGLSGS